MNDFTSHIKATETLEGFEVEEIYGHRCILETLFQLQEKTGQEMEQSRSGGPARNPVER